MGVAGEILVKEYHSHRGEYEQHAGRRQERQVPEDKRANNRIKPYIETSFPWSLLEKWSSGGRGRIVSLKTRSLGLSGKGDTRSRSERGWKRDPGNEVAVGVEQTAVCPGLNANEIQVPYYKHHKVSSLIKSHQDACNSVKYEVM